MYVPTSVGVRKSRAWCSEQIFVLSHGTGSLSNLKAQIRVLNMELYGHDVIYVSITIVQSACWVLQGISQPHGMTLHAECCKVSTQLQAPNASATQFQLPSIWWNWEIPCNTQHAVSRHGYTGKYHEFVAVCINCYEHAARVTIPTATKEWYFFPV